MPREVIVENIYPLADGGPTLDTSPQPAIYRGMATYISTTEAARRLGIHPRHVRHLLDSGTSGLRGEKIGRNWLVREKSLKNYSRHPTKGRPKSNGSS